MNERQIAFLRQWELQFKGLPKYRYERETLLFHVERHSSIVLIAAYKDDDISIRKSKGCDLNNILEYFIFCSYHPQIWEIIHLAVHEPDLVHERFLPTFKAMQEASRLLKLYDNWDNEGSTKIASATFLAMRYFVASYTTAMWHWNGNNKTLPAPRITASMNGSIDVDWDTPSAGLLANVKPNEESIIATEISYFWENKIRGTEKEGKFSLFLPTTDLLNEITDLSF